MSALPATAKPRPAWVLALSDRRYDRAPLLTECERAAVSELSSSRTRWPTDLSGALVRLTEPIDDVLGVVTPHAAWWGRYPARRALITGMAGGREAFWGWDRHRWVNALRDNDPQIRQIVMAVGYLLCGQRDVHLEFRGFKARKFAGRVFGAEPVDAAIARVARHLDALGAAAQLGRPNMQHALLDWMLLAGSPLLEDLAGRAELLAWLRSREINNARRYGVEQLSRTLPIWASSTPRRSLPSRRVTIGWRAAARASSACRSCGWNGSSGGFRPRRSVAGVARRPTSW